MPILRIEQSLATVGAKVGVAYAKPKKPKTTTSKRKGPLHRAAVAAIREGLTEGWPAYVGRKPGPEDSTCSRAPTASRAGPRARELRDDLLRAGLPTERDERPFELKGLRAAFATALEEAGDDERIIERLMGHRPVGVTEAHYTKREMGAMSAAVELIDIAWEAGLPPFLAIGHDAQGASFKRSVTAAGAAMQQCRLAQSRSRPKPALCSLQCGLALRWGNPQEYSEPPSGFEPETYGLLKRVEPVSDDAVGGLQGSECRRSVPDRNGATGTNGSENVPAEVLRCAGTVPALSLGWDAMEGALRDLGEG